MKRSTKIISVVLLFFFIIAAVIIARTMIGNHFINKLSKNYFKILLKHLAQQSLRKSNHLILKNTKF
jgi:membrane fusion protein (multidrug efflux system)